MLNLIGVTLAFLGTILMLYTTIISKPNKKGNTHAELNNIGPTQYKNKVFTIRGLSIIAFGFLLQLISAVKTATPFFPNISIWKERVSFVFLNDLLTNTLVGIVSGLFSGYVVSKHFKLKQRKEDLIKEFNEDKQNMTNYIRGIKIEIEFFIEELKEDRTLDTKDFKRILSKERPRTYSFVDNLGKEDSKKLIDISNLLNEIEGTINNEVTVKQLHDHRYKLTKAQLTILMFKMKK